MSNSTTNTADAYVPGVCNINYDEIKQRRMMGHVGAAVFVLVLIGLLISDLSRLDRIILVLPAGLGISGYLQARNHFCVGYAAAGKQNASEGSSLASAITDKLSLSADKKRALKMNLQTAVLAIVVTAVACLIPHI